MKLKDIRCIGIVGAGIMGSGIAQSAILAGYKVIVRDLKDEICEITRETIINGHFGIKASVEKGKITQKEMDKAVSLLNFTTKLEDLKDCDLVIEAIGGGADDVLENKGMKLTLFQELDKILKKEAIIASNTSQYTITDLAAVTQRKDRFVGMHLFRPANIMKLVEVICPKEVTEEVVSLIEELSKSWGKTPIRVKDVPGDTAFVANRVWMAARREAMKIVEEGIATAEDVNTAMELGFRWPLGPIPKTKPGRG
jgi:3-hydroxybutyryl-CoA dehydrogenase